MLPDATGCYGSKMLSPPCSKPSSIDSAIVDQWKPFSMEDGALNTLEEVARHILELC